MCALEKAHTTPKNHKTKDKQNISHQQEEIIRDNSVLKIKHTTQFIECVHVVET